MAKSSKRAPTAPKRKARPKRKATRGRRPPSAPLGISLRKFAELTKPPVSHTAVEKAIAGGRITVVRDARGRPRIPDVARALEEWEANRGRISPAPPTVAAGTAAPLPTNGSNGGLDLGTLSQAQIRVHNERAASLRLATLQKQGRLIDRAAASRESFEIARTVRDAILGVPDRVSAELAAETDTGRVHRRLEGELRTALGALAEIFAGGVDAEAPARPRPNPEDRDAVH